MTYLVHPCADGYEDFHTMGAGRRASGNDVRRPGTESFNMSHQAWCGTFIDGNILKRRDRAADEFEDLILHLTRQRLSKLGTQKLGNEVRTAPR